MITLSSNKLLLIILILFIGYNLINTFNNKKCKEKFSGITKIQEEKISISKPLFLKEPENIRLIKKYKLLGTITNKFITSKFYLYGKKVYTDDPDFYYSCLHKYVAISKVNYKHNKDTLYDFTLRYNIENGRTFHFWNKGSWIGPWTFISNK